MPEYFGPFAESSFLEPPSGGASYHFELEEFSLSFEGALLGLDFLHQENQDRVRRAKKAGVFWRGFVSFSNDLGNRKYVSEAGKLVLSRQSQQRHIALNWNRGFRVLLQGRYWRYSAIPKSASLPLLGSYVLTIAQDPVTVIDRISNSTKQVSQVFRIVTFSPSFLRGSLETLERTRIIYTMCDICNKEKKRNLEAKTVSWYGKQYASIVRFTTDEPYARVITVADFCASIARHIGSNPFRELLRKKTVLSVRNTEHFEREVAAIRDLDRGIRADWGELKLNPLEFGDTISEDDGGPSGGMDTTPFGEPMEEDEQIDHSMNEDTPMNDPTDPGSDRPVTPESETIPDSPLPTEEVDRSKRRPDAQTMLLLQSIPRAVFSPQVLRPDAVWRCPIPGCTLILMLREELPEELQRDFSHDELKFLRWENWTSKTKRSQRLLQKISGRHFIEHIEKLGLVIKTGSNGVQQIRRMNL